MNRLCKPLISLFSILSMLLLAGCGKNVIASYKYIKPETVHDLTIRKVEYTEDSLYIYVSGSDAKRITECTCFDKDCKPINCGWDLSAGPSRIKISGKLAKEISGVTMYLASHDEEYKVRYLDSEQCAMLYGVFVCDIGVEYTGDTERFKSDGERAAQKQREQAKKEATDAAYAFLEGRWRCENISVPYMYAYTDNDVRILNIDDTQYAFDNFRDVIQTADGNIQITISGDGWNSLFDIMELDIENDCVTHYGDTEDDVYYRADDDTSWDTERFGLNPDMLYYYDSYQYTDVNDMASLECGLRTTASTKSEETDFINSFVPDCNPIGKYSHPLADVLVYEKEAKTYFVFFISQSESSPYPKTAMLCKLDTGNMKPEAILAPDDEKKNDFSYYYNNGTAYTDENNLLNPYHDKYEYTDTTDDNGKLIKQEYTSDMDVYGTYDSTGVIYYDENEDPFFKYYYVTSGSRFTFYLRDNEKLKWICDIGGMAYSGMEGNDDIEIGTLFKIYRYEYDS